ncbi:MAG: hypothetical protein J6Y64_07025, partial [Ruminococcus sp.]|nr:hypothetical protein [Ruminococcus sp.]
DIFYFVTEADKQMYDAKRKKKLLRYAEVFRTAAYAAVFYVYLCISIRFTSLTKPALRCDLLLPVTAYTGIGQCILSSRF